MSPKTKRTLTATVSVLVIVGSVMWIYYTEFKAPQFNVVLHRRVGEVMAEETARVVNNKGKIVVLTIPLSKEPELKTQLDAFKRTLKKLGEFEIKESELDTKDQPKYGVGMGLSGRRFVRIANKNLSAAAIISFVGAPKLSDEDIKELTKTPNFIAEARSTDHLQKLFDKKLIQVVVVSRFQFPAPGTREPKTGEEWFTKRYQVVREQNAVTLPKPE